MDFSGFGEFKKITEVVFGPILGVFFEDGGSLVMFERAGWLMGRRWLEREVRSGLQMIGS